MTDQTETEIKPFTIEELTAALSVLEKKKAAAAVIASSLAGQIDNAKGEVERLETQQMDNELAAEEVEIEHLKFSRILATMLAFKKEQEQEHAEKLDITREILLQLKVENGGVDAAGVDRIAESLGITLETGFRDDTDTKPDI